MRKLVLAAEEEAAAAVANAERGIGGGGGGHRGFVNPVVIGAAVPVNVDAMDRGQKIALAVFVLRLIQLFSLIFTINSIILINLAIQKSSKGGCWVA